MARGGRAGHIGKWAPEMMLRLPITDKADVWGSGVALLELYSGRASARVSFFVYLFFLLHICGKLFFCYICCFINVFFAPVSFLLPFKATPAPINLKKQTAPVFKTL